MAYSTLKYDANHGAVKTCEQARQLHADRTRGQSGHQEGQPDEYALVAVVLAVKPHADEHLQELTEAFLAEHPQRMPSLQVPSMCAGPRACMCRHTRSCFYVWLTSTRLWRKPWLLPGQSLITITKKRVNPIKISKFRRQTSDACEMTKA